MRNYWHLLKSVSKVRSEILSFNHQARYIQRCQESMNRLYAAQQAYGPPADPTAAIAPA
ncbi:MAG: hypothetical protein IJI26_03750 [Clostridia bacterium]|nr:hypothetical protein [Clostridia bacterium]